MIFTMKKKDKEKIKSPLSTMNTMKIFLGFVDGDLYAVSRDKKLIKMYFEDIRHCSSKQYVIINKELPKHIITSTFEPYILESYNNFILPRREIDIIESDYPDIDKALKQFLLDFENLVYMAKCSKKLDGLYDRGKHDLKYYREVLQNPKVIAKLTNGYIHPLYHCDLKTCKSHIKRYYENLKMDQDYHAKVNDEKDIWDED